MSANTIDVVFTIRGDASGLPRDFSGARAAVEREASQITKTVTAQTSLAAEAFQKQFGYLPTIARQAVSQVGSEAQRAAQAVTAAARVPWQELEKYALTAKNRLEDAQLSRSLTRETNAIIAESKAAVAGLDKQVLGLRNSQDLLGKSFDNATEGVGGFAGGIGVAGLALSVLTGTTSLSIGAIENLVSSFFTWLTASREIVAVTTTEIEVTQQRISLLREEIELAQRLAGAEGENADAQQRIIEAKKKELELNIERQMVQEAFLRADLVNALREQEKAEILLQNHRIAAIQTGGDWQSSIKADTEKLDEARKKVKEVADAIEVYSRVTGISREEIYKVELARAKESDALGKTYGLYEDLLRVLKLTVDAEGRLVPTTDAVTEAINRQTEAIKRRNTALEASRNLRDAVIQDELTRLANTPGMTPQKARKQLEKDRLESSLFVTKDDQGKPIIGLDQAIREAQQARKVTEALDKIINPPKERKEKDDEGRAEIEKYERRNQALADAARNIREALKREYDLGIKDRESYYAQLNAALNKTYNLELSNLKLEEDTARARIKKQDELDNKLLEIENKRNKLKFERDKERVLQTDAETKERIEAEVNALKRIDEAQKFYEDKQLKEAEDFLKQGVIQEGDIENLRFEQKSTQLDRRLEIIQKEKEAWGEYSEKYRQLSEAEAQVDRERLAAKEQYTKRIMELFMREQSANLFKVAPQEKDYNFDWTFGLGPPPEMFDLLGDFKKELKSVGTVSQQMSHMITDSFKSVTQGIGQMIQSYVLLGNEGGMSLRKLAAAAIASVAAQAAVDAIYSLAKGLVALAIGGPFAGHSAGYWFTASALFASIAGVAAVAGRAVAGNAFQQAGGSNSADSSASGNSSQTSTSGPKPIVTGRTGEQPVPTTRDQEISRLGAVVDKLASTVARLSSATPGSVLMAGAQQAPNVIPNSLRDDYRLDGITRRIIRDDRA